MSRKKTKKDQKQIFEDRPYIKVYKDFLESDIFDNCSQKIMYIVLKLLSNHKGQCISSTAAISEKCRFSKSKARKIMNELVQKGLVKKFPRTWQDGGTNTNLYIINDSSGTWGSGYSSNKSRPSVKVYKDIFDNGHFDSDHSILVYICLEKFADKNQECSPTMEQLAKIAMVSVRKTGSILEGLIEKGMVSKQEYYREGGETGSLYTLLYNLK